MRIVKWKTIYYKNHEFTYFPGSTDGLVRVPLGERLELEIFLVVLHRRDLVIPGRQENRGIYFPTKTSIIPPPLSPFLRKNLSFNLFHMSRAKMNLGFLTLISLLI